MTGCYQSIDVDIEQGDTGSQSQGPITETGTGADDTDESEVNGSDPGCDVLVCEGDFFIRTAYELSSVSGCTAVTGTVSVSQLTDGSSANRATNLADFECLERIEGDLSLTHLKEIEDLHGLDRLTRVNGNVEIGMSFITDEYGTVVGYGIDRNRSLRSLTGLEGLVSVGGSMIIGENPRLVSLDELNSLSEISKDLFIFDNENLLTCEATSLRDRLKTIGGKVEISGNVEDSCAE